MRNERIIVLGVLCTFLAVPVFLRAAEENAGAGLVLEKLTADIGDVMENGAAMGTDEMQAAAARIDAAWKSFTEAYGQDQWHQDDEGDSLVKAAGILLAQARTGFENKGFPGAAEAYAGALPLLKILGVEFNKPVLADFTGAQCKVCKIMKARLAKVDEEYGDRVRIVLVNVNTQKELTKQYKIMLIPTLVFIDRGGKEVFRSVGEMEEKAVKAKLEELLKQ